MAGELFGRGRFQIDDVALWWWPLVGKVAGVQRAGPAAVPSLFTPASGFAAVVLGRGMATVIDGLKYASSHEWVKVDGDVATVGVTDFAQSELGDVVYVEVPEVGTEFGSTGESFGVLESTKAAR